MRLFHDILLVVLLLVVGATAQSTFDLAGGAGSVADNWGSWVHTSGLWTTVNGTAMFTPHVGISADFNAHTIGRVFGDRPYLGDVNLALRASRSRLTPELDLGWGGASIPTGGECANFPVAPCSEAGRHFRNGAHLSFSVMVYASRHWFVRPIYHLYVGKNMGHPQFFGAMIGYEFGGR